MSILKGQPKALPFLFLTEMWERFGFYVTQGLLVLYMTQYFGFSDNQSYGVLGVFTALAYISPLIGGYLADKILGFKTAIIWGGLILVVGYAMLALPFAKALFYPALATIIVGNGLFKPNISSLLGSQYDLNDPRRDSGFTIFYIGINIGALLAGLSSGYIKETFGWHTSFGLASTGLIIGLLTFAFGYRYIKAPLAAASNTRFKLQFLVCCVLAVACFSFLLTINTLANLLLPILGVMLLVFLSVLIARQTGQHRKNLIILTTLIVSSIVFWTLFLQLFFSANLFVDRLVYKEIFGIHLTTTVFYGSEGFFIILLGPVFAWFWNKSTHYSSPIIKFVFGIFFAGLGFLTLALSTYFPNSIAMINPGWVFLSYLLITIGELLLSPIGLSAVTQLAPANLVGMMMGIWFVATGFGGIFAGQLAKLSSVPESASTIGQMLAIYQHAFFYYAYLAFFVALALFLLHTGMKRFTR
jgi:POT family proton-dependent oligopeptide transporter